MAINEEKQTLPIIDDPPHVEENVNIFRADETKVDEEKYEITTPGITTWHELSGMVFVQLMVFVQGLITEGFTILAGKPKQGKSTLINDMILAIAAGTKAFGDLEVTKADVALLALESSPRRLQNDIQKMSKERQGAFKKIYTLFDWNSDLSLYAGLTSIIKQNRNIKVIVIDTIGRFLDISGGSKAGYEKRYQVGAIIKDIADEFHVAIIGVHHLRKGRKSEDHVDAIMGSSGLTAAADNIITLERIKNSGITTLEVSGRNVSDNHFNLKFDEDTRSFLSLANHPELLLGREARAILNIIKTNGGEISFSEIQEKAGKNKSAVSNHLKTLTDKQHITKLQHGKYITADTDHVDEQDSPTESDA